MQFIPHAARWQLIVARRAWSASGSFAVAAARGAVAAAGAGVAAAVATRRAAVACLDEGPD